MYSYILMLEQTHIGLGGADIAQSDANLPYCDKVTGAVMHEVLTFVHQIVGCSTRLEDEVKEIARAADNPVVQIAPADCACRLLALIRFCSAT